MENNEVFNFEDRNYVNPTLSRDEQASFIDTLRQTQQANTQQVNVDTYALGSQLPSRLGGLSGAEGTFTARYQTPQTEATISQLREVAQASALQTAMNNRTDAWKKRYQDAMNNYKRRSLTPSNNPSNNPNDPLKNLLDVVPHTKYPVSSTTQGGQIGSALTTPDGETRVYGMNPDGTPSNELLASTNAGNVKSWTDEDYIRGNKAFGKAVTIPLVGPILSMIDVLKEN